MTTIMTRARLDFTGDALTVWVPGRPAPQGSKRYVGNGVSIESSKHVKPWRADIRAAMLDAHTGDPMTGPVTVLIEFVMPRPAATPKRATPPAIKRPDIDKLTRAVLDAIGSAGVWFDDSQVTHLVASKRLAERDEAPGAVITVAAASHLCDACQGTGDCWTCQGVGTTDAYDCPAGCSDGRCPRCTGR